MIVTRVGNYELEDEIFSSGPSTFFNARNVILGNPVVVRRLTIDPARADDVRVTFFREVRHQASFQHPAIWAPLDILDLDGFLWSVHPIRRGTPSEEKVRTAGPMSLSEASHFGGEIADALGHMHERGSVHGRVAPRWILVDGRGAQLASFTKSADLAAGIWPLRAAVAGLSPFSAPEELRGHRPTAESDVYSLAATILWWTSMQYPSGGTTPEEAMDRVQRGAKRIEVASVRPDIPAVLAAADLFALSSDDEGLPMVVIEAMASGLAVAATDVGSVRELVVDGETGLVVPRRDPAALASAIRALLGDDARRGAMGKAGRARVAGRFPLARCVAETEAYLKKAAGRD